MDLLSRRLMMEQRVQYVVMGTDKFDRKVIYLVEESNGSLFENKITVTELIPSPKEPLKGISILRCQGQENLNDGTKRPNCHIQLVLQKKGGEVVVCNEIDCELT